MTGQIVQASQSEPWAADRAATHDFWVMKDSDLAQFDTEPKILITGVIVFGDL